MVISYSLKNNRIVFFNIRCFNFFIAFSIFSD